MKVMSKMIDDKKAIHLESLMQMDIRKESDTDTVNVFYVEAASLVGFLIRGHGSKQFIEFCRQLRDGKTIETALTFAYPTKMRNLEQLEEKWLKYVKMEGAR